MFKVWMELLKEVPGSVLWLMKLNDAAQANLTKEALKHGVDPTRMVYATRVPLVEDHLARYRLADLFLDTYPYNGHTTAGDALSAGLPVLTMSGGSFASRVAASLMHDIGDTNLVCSTLQQYQENALKYASNNELRLNTQKALQKKLESKAWPPSSIAQANEIQKILNSV